MTSTHDRMMLLLYIVCTFQKRVSVKENLKPDIIVFSEFFFIRVEIKYSSEFDVCWTVHHCDN